MAAARVAASQMAAVRMVAALAIAAMAAVACGSDGNDDARAEATTTSSSEAPARDERFPPPAEGTSIADVLRSDERFSRFAELVGMTETRIPGRPTWLEVWDWSGEHIGDDRDGVTVFAPTDAAFEAADPALIERLSRDDDATDALRYSLLSEHYAHYRFPSDDFAAGPQRTWRGTIEMGVDPLTWGGFAIVETDIEASNGWVHAVDGLVVPDVVQRAVDEG